MNPMELANKLGWMPPRVVAWLEKRLKDVPAVQREIEKEYVGIMDGLEASLKPYRDEFLTFEQLPQNGRSHTKILQEMEALHDKESVRWQDGYVSGAVYHGDAEHIEFLNKVYAINSQSNPLHADLWPSTTKFEAEVVSMTANMMGADAVDDDICGVVSSGGTDSILLAMKTYRDWARETKGIRHPEMIAPVTAHAAFDKAAQYFNIKMVHVPVDANYRADVTAVKKAINR
ncbi:MAG: aspartate aminotransferase family protein, partial [Chloroflexi bacterium]|nr:aspartate aminotransferase family protein [Chloroflexota bacterium]